MLKSMHKGTRHIGKAPAVWQQTKLYVDRLHSLQTRLDKAVAKEDYEKAAQVRDEISRVKSEFSESSIV